MVSMEILNSVVMIAAVHQTTNFRFECTLPAFKQLKVLGQDISNPNRLSQSSITPGSISTTVLLKQIKLK